MQVQVLVITGTAPYLRRIVFEKSNDYMVRKPLALDAVIINVVAQT
jgi:hypothetical protein